MAGRGYPVFDAQRVTPTNQNEPAQLLLPNGQVSLQSKGPYDQKRVFRIVIDCTNVFTDQLFSNPGTLIWMSGQNGGTAAPMYVRLDNTNNDPIQFTYDRAVSGIPFQQVYISNPTAQPGVTVEFTVTTDTPRDRVGLNG